MRLLLIGFDAEIRVARAPFLLASAAVPLVFIVYAGVFAYRHTARRRKTQAMITAILALFLTIGFHLAASQLFPNRLVIPRSYQARPAR